MIGRPTATGGNLSYLQYIIEPGSNLNHPYLPLAIDLSIICVFAHPTVFLRTPYFLSHAQSFKSTLGQDLLDTYKV